MEKLKKNKKQNNDYKITKNDEDLNIISSNLKEERKKNKILKEKNEQLIKDIITVKTKIKSLIPCLSQNRFYPFPTLEELIIEIENFINNDSVKLYNRLQKRNNFSIELIIIHFKTILKKCHDLISNHFSNVNIVLNEKFKNAELIKPLNSIIKNSYQINWKLIYNKLVAEDKLNLIIQEIKQNIYNKSKQNPNIIIGYSSSLINCLKEYIKISIEIFLKCYISQPQINIDLSKIGNLQQYNFLNNECLLDENIVRGDECYLIIPSFYYNESGQLKKNEIINKDKIIRNNNKNNSSNNNNFCVNKSNNYAVYKNIPNLNINNSIKSNNFNLNNSKNDSNSKVNYREKKNYGNDFYNRKKYSEIYFNSKSYANRNVNYYNINTNNSVSNNNTKKLHFNRNRKNNLKDRAKNNSKKERKKYFYSDYEDIEY